MPAPPGTARRAHTNTVRRALAALLAALLVIAVADAVARWCGVRPFHPVYPRGLHCADPQLGLRPAPGFEGVQIAGGRTIPLRINAQGLRGKPLGPKRPGTLRVAVLGDSLVFGHGVREEETMAARLQNRFDTIAPGHVEVLNAGVMSYGTVQEVGFLRHVVAPLAPDFVLLVFFAGNDPLENVSAPLTVIAGQPAPPGLEGPRRWILPWKLSLKYHLAIWRVLAALRGEPRIPHRCTTHPAFGLELCRRKESARTRLAWERTRNALGDFLDAALAAGAMPAVAVLPARYQVYGSWWSRHCRDCRIEDAGAWDRFLAVNQAVRISRESGLRTLNLLPRLLRVAGDEPLYSCDTLLEMHLTPRGHAEVARILFEAWGGLFAGKPVPPRRSSPDPHEARSAPGQGA